MAGLAAVFFRSGPAPQPGDGDLDRPVPEAPPSARGEDAPGPLRPEAQFPRTDPPPPTVAAPSTPPSTPQPPRGPRPVRVVDAAGAPIVGAEVAVLDDMPDLRPGIRRGAVPPPRTAGATDTDGAYVVGADVPRAGALRVRATGFAEKTVGLEPFPTEIRLTPSRTLRVRVIDERGKAIAGATVRAVGPLRDAEVTTDAYGRVDLLADGTDWRRLEVFADGFRIEQHDTTLRALPRADPITVVLHAARPLVGRVVADEDGKPLEGATVTLVSGAVERGTFATTTTRPDGSFALGIGMPRYRVYALEVTAPDRLPAFVSVSPVDAWEKPPEIRLDRGRPVDGIVTEGSGAPVVGVRVQATPAYARTTSIAEREATTLATTDAQGRFQVRVPKAGADASWHVVARGTNGAWGSVPVPRGDVADAPLVVVLEGTGFLEGRVMSSAGVGVDGMRVRPTATASLAWLVASEPTPEGTTGGAPSAVSTDSTVTAPDGTFRLGPLPAGDVELAIEQEGQRLGRPMTARVLGGQTVALPPLLLDVGEISGVVLDHAGRGVPRAFVRLTRGPMAADDATVRDARTDELGRFRFTALDKAEAMSIEVVGQALTSAKLERAYPRAEPYELRLTRSPQLTLTVMRGGQLYDGPLLVRFFLKGAPPDRGGSVVTAYPQTWWTSVSGLISLPLPSVATYTVEVRTAEEEPAQASGDTTIDSSEPTVMRVTLDLRIPDPAAPEGGTLPGK